MKEQRFEKVVEWKESEYVYRHTGVCLFLTISLFGFILPLLLIKNNPSLDQSFFPIGLIWIFILIISGVTLAFFYERKVYWRRIK